MFGTFDRAQLQRGFQVYKEVCSNCHRLSIPFRTLADPTGPGYTEDQVKALAATYQVTNDEPNDKGEIFKRPGTPADDLPAAGRFPERSGRRRAVRQGAAGHVAARQVAQIRARLPVVHLRHLHRLSGDRRGLHLRDPQRLHEVRRSAVEPLLSRPQDRDAAAADRTARSNIPTARPARCRTTRRTSPPSCAGRPSRPWSSARRSACAPSSS